jgi:hypothetical protein
MTLTPQHIADARMVASMCKALPIRAKGNHLAAQNDESEPAVTGWPLDLLQDGSRGLSKWLAGKPDARMHAREAAQSFRQIEDECNSEARDILRGRAVEASKGVA